MDGGLVDVGVGSGGVLIGGLAGAVDVAACYKSGSVGVAVRVTSCGVLVRDGAGLVLLGQATGSARWDIPKGVAEAGEDFAAAALRELGEETGLLAEAGALRAIGVFKYMPGKDLALFGWECAVIDVAGLRCGSMFTARDGRVLPEMARFAMVPWAEALGRVGKNMRRVLECLPERPMLAG